MRPARRLSTAGAVAATGLLLAACGGSGSPSRIAGLSAADVIRVSSQNLQGTSMRFDLNGRFAVDASGLTGVPAGQLDQLGAILNGVQLSGSGEQESPQRVRVTMSLKPLLDKTITAVLYDGKAYYSEDGTRFAEMGSLRSLTSGIGTTPSDIRNYLDGLGNVRDLGSTGKDGLTVEHYQATVDQSFLSKALGAASPGSSPNPMSGMAPFLAQLIHIDSGTVDAYVDPQTARLDRTTVNLSMTFDLGKLAQAFGGLAQGSQPSGPMPGGTLRFTIAADVHTYGYGDAIHVSRPQVDPTAPTPPSSSGLFGA